MQKGTLVSRALYKIAVSGTTVPPTTEDITNSLNILEDMMSEYEGWGIELGYRFEDFPRPASQSGIPFWATSPIYNNLALKIIGSFEYEPTQILLANAAGGMALLMQRTDEPIHMIYPSRMPKGSGNTLRYRVANRYYRKDNQ